MKYYFLVLLVLFSVKGNCQTEDEIKITYSNTDVSILEVFHDLEKNYDIRISYATSSEFSDKINVDFANEELQEAIKIILTNKNIECKIVSNNVLLRKAPNYKEILDENYMNSIHIKGSVFTKSEKKDLSLATIAIEGTSVGTYTDDQGNFDIEIPEEYIDSKLVISYVGYAPMSYVINELEDSFLLVALNESSNIIKEVRIVNREKPIRINSAKNILGLNASQISDKTSGVVGSNINRNIQLLPGFTAHNDNSSELEFRGSTGDATMTILDGIPIYKTSHYYGIFSTINSSYVDSLNVFRNVFPISLSGKTGGIVEMISDQPPVNKFTAEIDINLLNSETYLAVPISKKSSFHLSTKSTWTKVNNSYFTTKKNRDRTIKNVNSFKDKIENNNSSPGVNFYDFHSKYQWSNNYKNIWSFNFFHSKEAADNVYETDVTNSFNNKLELNIEEEGRWTSTGASILGSNKLTKKLRYSTRTYFTLFNRVERNNIQIESSSSNGPQGIINFSALQDNRILDFGQSHQFLYKVNKHKIIGGIEYGNSVVDYTFRENGKRLYNGLEKIGKLSLFTSYDRKFYEKLLVNVGLRANYYYELNEILYSPRILLNYDLSTKFSIKSSFSIYQQVVRQLYFEYRSVPMELWVSSLNPDIPILQSYNYMLGTTFKGSIFSMDIEAFYKKLSGAVEYASLNPVQASINSESIQDYRLFVGDGRVLGIDFIISSGYKNYETYLSYTLSRAEERYKQINKNEYYSSENDRRHQLKWVNSYSVNNWKFGLNSIFSSGRLYTNITNTGINDDIRESTPDQRFARLPAYRRVDISSGYTFSSKNRKAELSLSIFNVFNFANVKYIQSVITTVQENEIPFSSVVGGENSLLNRTVNLGLRVYL